MDRLSCKMLVDYADAAAAAGRWWGYGAAPGSREKPRGRNPWEDVERRARRGAESGFDLDVSKNCIHGCSH